MPHGHTITGTIYNSVTLGAGVYGSPLTIAPTGVINENPHYDSSLANRAGVYVPRGEAGGKVVNDGLILGGHGGYGSGGPGGYGVSMAAAATLGNAGTVMGGFGGSYLGNGYAGGTAAFAFGGSVTNTGLMQGGGGGGGYYSSAYGGALSGGGGAGGAGVVLSDGASLSNAGGEIVGGAGGTNSYNYHYPYAGRGGVGVALSGAFAGNSGTISGGAGGYETGAGKGGDGGDGLDISAAGTLYNFGSINGGSGGVIGGGYGGVAGHGGAGVSVLGAGAYVYNAGVIVGGAGGGFANAGEGQGGDGTVGLAGAGVEVLSGAYLYNTGTVTGGAGASAEQSGGTPFYQVGGHGGAGATLKDASGYNTGLISGGRGGVGYGAGYLRAGHGGVGLEVSKGGFVNSGQIEGGAGGTCSDPGGPGPQGVGGIGVALSHAAMSSSGFIGGGYGGGDGATLAGRATLTNSGTVVGGTGRLSYGVQGYAGGAGVAVYSGSKLINTGLITGGYGGYGYGGNGGAGIFIDGGKVIDSGTVVGGHFGYGHVSVGDDGDAVVFGSLAGTLELKPGASFGGNYGYVAANAAVQDVLELAGRSHTILAGIGTEITGFNEISFAAGARWAIAGDVAALAGGQQIAGFGVGDTIYLDDAAAANGTATVSQAGVVSIDAGGETYKVDILGATVGEAFSFADDALTETRVAMTFLKPAESAAAVSLPVLVSDAGGFRTAAAPVLGMTAASVGGTFEPVTLGLSGVPVVTLQS
jgi:hypothetical protein